MPGNQFRRESYTPTVQLIENSPNSSEISGLRSQLIGLAQRREFQEFRSRVHKLIVSPGDPAFLDAVQVLHLVTWSNKHHDLALKLLDIGCNPFATDYNGDTTLHYAVRGTNIEYLDHIYRKMGNEALGLLNIHQCNLLLAVCADTPDERSYEVLRLLEWLYFRGFSLESQDSQGKTPLMWAAQRGSLIVCQWIISRGGNLAHQDQMGRNALYMACSSGKGEVALFLCQKGAVHLIDHETNDDKRVNTAKSLCWQRGHLWLSLSLSRWQLWHSITGTCTFLSNQYSWYAIFLLLWNAFAGSMLVFELLKLDSTYTKPWDGVYLVSMSSSIICWLIAAKSDPGCVKDPEAVLPSQKANCNVPYSDSWQVLSARPIPTTNVAMMQLRKLEVEAKKESHALSILNRKCRQPTKYYRGLSPDLDAQFDTHIARLANINEAMNRVREQVGLERQREADPEYVSSILVVQPNGVTQKRVCFTCHMQRPFRSYHCSECGICVNRFDHHCVWIDNCVGLRNQRAFIFFLYSMVLALTSYYCLVGFYIHDSLARAKDQYGQTDLPARALLRLLTSAFFYITILNSAANLVWAGFIGYLGVRTTRSMFTDVTFYEGAKL